MTLVTIRMPVLFRRIGGNPMPRLSANCSSAVFNACHVFGGESARAVYPFNMHGQGRILFRLSDDCQPVYSDITGVRARNLHTAALG